MRAARPVIERALPKIDRTEEGGCWVWTGALSRGGYGQIRSGPPDYPLLYAHRLMYEHHIGPIPDGLQLDHLCRNRACCNPQHLEPVSARENQLRGSTLTAINLAKSHCKQGHPFDQVNTYWSPKGHRTCRTCRREGMRRYWSRNR